MSQSSPEMSSSFESKVRELVTWIDQTRLNVHDHFYTLYQLDEESQKSGKYVLLEHTLYHPDSELKVALRLRHCPRVHLKRGLNDYIEDQVEVIPLADGHYNDSYTENQYKGSQAQEVMNRASDDLIAHCVRVWLKEKN